MRDLTLLEKAVALFPKINEKEVSVSETVSIVILKLAQGPTNT